MSLDSVAAALGRIAAQEAHSKADCFPGYEGHTCTCDRDERVAARQAEAVLAAVEEAADAASYNGAQRMQPGCRGYEPPIEAFMRVLAQRADDHDTIELSLQDAGAILELVARVPAAPTANILVRVCRYCGYESAGVLLGAAPSEDKTP